MKRLHAHIFVKDIEQSTHFYNELFAEQPSLIKADYIRWELSDPPMNFAISNYGKPGIDHLGIQSESDEALNKMVGDISLTEQAPAESSCCYARSSKTWLSDPQGIQWELYHTHTNDLTDHDAQPTGCCPTSGCSG